MTPLPQNRNSNRDSLIVTHHHLRAETQDSDLEGGTEERLWSDTDC